MVAAAGLLILIAALAIAAYDTADQEKPMPNIPVERMPFRVKAMIILGIAFVALCVAIGVARADDRYHSNPWLLSWIPATCCVTNDCCWQIAEREVRSLPDDEWQVLSTGQIRKRTDWSPDGKFYRCACDYDKGSKQWVRHQGANTRCIFVPMRSAGR